MSTEAAFQTQVLHFARVTIEAVSPISLGSGDPSSFSDAMVFRDANDLPQIPGSSLEGVARHLWRETHSGVECDCERMLFGVEDNLGDGRTGRLAFGFGAVHDAQDRAIVGLVLPSEIEDDKVLQHLRCATPVLRHHVKLNERHVADERAKFDRSAVPIGTRFSFEIATWGPADTAEDDKRQLIEVLRLLCHPGFRLGGASRRGYGVVALKRASYERPDPADAAELRRLREQPPSTPLHEPLVLSPDGLRATVATVTLRPLGPWRIGTTYRGRRCRRQLLGQPSGCPLSPRSAPGRVAACAGERRADIAEEAADILVLREPRLTWSGASGRETATAAIPRSSGLPPRFVVPGSALRGPLVHRMLFHWNKAQGHLLDADAPDAAALFKTSQERPEAFADLLGVAKGQSASKSRAARLFVADGVGTGVQAAQALTHNVLDRFSGGVINRLLYSEEVIIGGEITIELTILPARNNAECPALVVALCAALHDLCNGRLALGAKSHGFCEGTVAWSGSAREIWQRQWHALAPPRQPAPQRPASQQPRAAGARR